MARPLEGIRVLDLTWALSGPFGTMVLADLGAEVIKVERRIVGDLARGSGPFVDDISTYFFSINRGKKSITLDLKTAKGKDIFLALIEQVDVVTENFVPGTMDKLGLGFSVLREHNPRLIYAATSGFGQTGPYSHKPALDIIVQAMSGMMSITGEPGGPPLRVGASVGDIAAGMFMAIGILAAIHERSKSGLGQMVDISMLDCQLALMENAYVRHLNTGEVPRAIGTRHPVSTPFQAYRTKDNWVVIAMGGGSNAWPLFCAALDRLDLMDDERFQSSYSRTQHIEILEPMLAEAILKKTTAEWIEILEGISIPCAPINGVEQAAVDPHINSRQMFAEVPVEGKHNMRVVNTPVKLSRTPGGAQRRAPDMGEHTRDVLAALLNLSEEEISALEQDEVI